VPAFAAVQAWSPADRRARVIAGVNVMNAAYMVVGGALVAALQAAGLGVGVLFALLGLLTFGFIATVLRAWFVSIALVHKTEPAPVAVEKVA
jgi:acyl-[acyl-carrier-protein]-phospholipid O-acyltransferase/long-chain-fatty-acid--[acyl-carrier-protein] ligase